MADDKEMTDPFCVRVGRHPSCCNLSKRWVAQQSVAVCGAERYIIGMWGGSTSQHSS
jgi:hypothetical protein